MGNTISSPFGLRSCGLCYFKLPAGTPFLDQPAVSRKVSPTWPQSKLKEGRLDDVLRPKKDILNVVMKTTLSAIKASAKRGCVGCEAILKCLESQVGDHGFVLDETSWADQCTLTWLVGNRKSNNPSLFIEVKVPATIDGLAKHRAEQFSMMLGYTGDKFGISDHSFHCQGKDGLTDSTAQFTQRLGKFHPQSRSGRQDHLALCNP